MNTLRVVALAATALMILSQAVRAHVAAEEMAELAGEFLQTLTAEQKAKAVFPLNDEERFNWHFVPRERNGLSIKEMSRAQRDALHGFLDAALSQRGYVKTTSIMSLEKILFEKEKQNPIRDPEKYYISIFGEPSDEGTWAWRFEGHHLSMNVTIVDGKLLSGTPVFLGANPAEVQEGPRKGFRALAAEEDLARQLAKSLDEDQRKHAVFSATAPREIITGNKRKVEPLSPQGLPLAEMNKEQGELLLKLVREFIDLYRTEMADDDWRKIKNAGIEFIHFAWAGGMERGEGHYYRVQGPTFLLEYDNTQNKANHVHVAWRDFNSDFGDDLLKKHYEQAPHKKP